MTPRRLILAALLLTSSGCVPLAGPAEPPGPGRDLPAPWGDAPDAAAPAVDRPDSATSPAPVDSAPGPTDAAAVAPELPSDAAVPAADPRGIESASVSGFQLLVRRRNPDGTVAAPQPFDIKGISWSPHDRGGEQPSGADYLRAADKDLPLMKAANINAVKTYQPADRALLDKLHAHGMVAIVGVLSTANAEFEPTVMQLRDHPALLMWIVGNEWNLNRLYGSCAADACYQRVNEVARRIKALDAKHPVATSFAPVGEIPSEDDLRRLDAIDIWGLNVYSRPGFFNRFVDWRALANRSGIKKPFFLSEYGADAFDNRAGRPDEAAQAAALRAQTLEIRQQLSARNPAFACLGGTPFEWNDEWWKRGNNAAQDPGGFAHSGVAADGFANEEWWGVVDIDRRPRPAYQVLQELYAK